jgi:tetratricopeptide (TPR) repeat protein
VIVMLRHRAPAIAAACACYAMIVAPVLGLVQTGSQLVADRYSYQCTLPLALLAGGAILYASERLRATRSGAMLGAGLLVLAIAALAPLALATRAQIRVWHDTLSLWEHDVAVDPGDSPGRRNLVAAWMDIGKAQTDAVQRAASFERALAECRKGMEQRPDAACMLNAAKIYDLMAGDSASDRQRHLETALDYGRRGVAIVERTLQRLPEIYESCGVILCELSRPAEALPYFERALALDSANANRHGMLAEALIQAGRTREAAAQLEEAVRLAPETATLWLDLADTRRHLGERDAALAAYRRVIALKQDTRGATVATDADWAAAQRAVEELGRK